MKVQQPNNLWERYCAAMLLLIVAGLVSLVQPLIAIIPAAHRA
jgi:hypothetical protein